MGLGIIPGFMMHQQQEFTYQTFSTVSKIHSRTFP